MDAALAALGVVLWLAFSFIAGDIAARLVRPRVGWRTTFPQRALIVLALLLFFAVAAPSLPPLGSIGIPVAVGALGFLAGLDARVEPVGPWYAFWRRRPVR